MPVEVRNPDNPDHVMTFDAMTHADHVAITCSCGFVERIVKDDGWERLLFKPALDEAMAIVFDHVGFPAQPEWREVIE